jgi:nitrate/nitrite transporter NarK
MPQVLRLCGTSLAAHAGRDRQPNPAPGHHRVPAALPGHRRPALRAVADRRRRGFDDVSVITPLLIGLALLTIFIVYALRARTPLVDLRLFTVSSFASSTALMFLSGFVLYGALLVMPLYFQDIRGQTPLHTGLLLAPQGIGILASRGLAGSLTDRIGSRWVVFVGMIFAAAGTIPFAYADSSTNQWLLMAALVVRGFGLGGVTLPLFATAYLGLDKGQIADASIITRAAQQIGGSFGSAILALILANQLTHHPADHTHAHQTTFWFTIAFTLAAILLALWLPTRTRGRTTQSPAAKADPAVPDSATP